MTISIIINIDEDIVLIYNDKNAEFFSKDIIDVFLKVCRYIDQVKKYHLVFKLAISYLEYRFLFVSFANSHLMVYTSKVKLG